MTWFYRYFDFKPKDNNNNDRQRRSKNYVIDLVTIADKKTTEVHLIILNTKRILFAFNVHFFIGITITYYKNQ